MPWQQLKIHTSPDHADTLSDALTEFGASAVTCMDSEDDPIYEPPIGTTPFWQHTTVTGLFPAEVGVDDIISQIGLKLGGDIVSSWVVEQLEDQVWEKAWMEHFEPMKFGDNLWICPSWKAIPDPGAVNLMLDPGLAFGTGTHPTTALCLEALSHRNLEGSQIIDYGCGSGILAIAGVLLGATHAWCIDTDPQALQATQENARKNAVDEKIHLSLADLVSESKAEFKANLLIANILAKPLTELAAHFASLLNADADIILSGIIEQQEQEIVQAYKPWFDIINVSQSGEWLCIEGRRKKQVPG